MNHHPPKNGRSQWIFCWCNLVGWNPGFVFDQTEVGCWIFFEKHKMGHRSPVFVNVVFFSLWALQDVWNSISFTGGFLFTPMAVDLFDPTFYWWFTRDVSCLGLVTLGRVRSHVKQWSREGGGFLQSFFLFRKVALILRTIKIGRYEWNGNIWLD